MNPRGEKGGRGPHPSRLENRPLCCLPKKGREKEGIVPCGNKWGEGISADIINFYGEKVEGRGGEKGGNPLSFLFYISPPLFHSFRKRLPNCGGAAAFIAQVFEGGEEERVERGGERKIFHSRASSVRSFAKELFDGEETKLSGVIQAGLMGSLLS